MTLIDLGEPAPRKNALSLRDFEYSSKRKILLDPPAAKPQKNVFSVLERRQTRRDFHLLSYEQISQLLWYSIKRRSAVVDSGRYIWQHAATPSAGGCHPIDILIIGVADEANAVFYYDPIGHALAHISEPNEEARGKLQQVAIQSSGAKSLGTLFWFAAQPSKTHSRYNNPGSLIWRDSGALLATIGIIAEALSLNCCALGPTGNPMIARMINGKDFVVGTGGCIVGTGSSNTTSS
jgi:SagB-type dehydrogenase family enzyme